VYVSLWSQMIQPDLFLYYDRYSYYEKIKKSPLCCPFSWETPTFSIWSPFLSNFSWALSSNLTQHHRQHPSVLSLAWRITNPKNAHVKIERHHLKKYWIYSIQGKSSLAFGKPFKTHSSMPRQSILCTIGALYPDALPKK
jgi:hypothetical protein